MISALRVGKPRLNFRAGLWFCSGAHDEGGRYYRSVSGATLTEAFERWFENDGNDFAYRGRGIRSNGVQMWQWQQKVLRKALLREIAG